MANKPFAIQGADLTLGGVKLEAGANSIVIPGITQATSYRVEEVEETGEQDNTLNLPIVIDNVTHAAKVANTGTSVSAYATYSVQLDDEDYIEELEVNTGGTYVGSEVDRNADFDMWGYTGSDAEGYLTNWVTGDWVQIPFRPKMRVGEVENVGGGADLGNFTIEGNTLEVASGTDIYVQTYDTESQGESRLVLKPQDDGAENPTRLEGAYNVGIWANTSDINNAKEWLFGTDGHMTFPDGTVQVTAFTGQSGSASDTNIWIETFASDAPSTDFVQTATSVEYDADGNVFALLSHYVPSDNDNTYTSVAKLTPTGAILWQVRLSAALNTDGWGLAYYALDNFVYVAGRLSGTPTTYNLPTLMKIQGGTGTVDWSKTYDFGVGASSTVVDVTSDGHPVMVGYGFGPQDNFIHTTKIDYADGSVIWSEKVDGQGDEEAYGMAVGSDGTIVTVGYMDQYTDPASYPVTPLTGSTTSTLVINRSDLSGAVFTDTWQVAGTGISGYAGISAINLYNALTGTTRQGSGAVFDIGDNGDGTYLASGIQNAGTNYLAGHKILVLGTALGGATPANDCTVTVVSTSGNGEIFQWSVAGTAAGTVFTPYGAVTGTNYQVGSGLSFDFTGDAGSTYTEHTTNIFAGGSNYVTGDVITIPGTQLGGTTPANDLIATVSATNGVVTQFNSFSGNAQTTTYRVSVEDPTVDFGGAGSWTLDGSTTDNADRMIVIKYYSDGEPEWKRAIQFDEGFDCSGADADIDADGNIYVCGSYEYTAEGFGTTSAMNLVKFNSSGVKQWSRRVVGNCDTFGTSIVVGDDGYLYLSGVTANNNASEYTWVIAKYDTTGTVVWQRLIDNTTTWTFGGTTWFSGGGGSNIAVKNGYVALAGTFGDPGTQPSAVILQLDTDATPFSLGDWDITGATFSGTLNGTASDITVVNANKTSSIITPTPADQSFSPDSAPFLTITRYSNSVGNDSLVNGTYSVSLSNTGTVTLPAGGTITEGYVTSNPTIQLTPASPTVASQKLVIKGGSNYAFSDNGIEINYNNNTAIVGDTLTFYVYSNTYADQTLYWWIYPQGAGIGDTESDTVVMEGSSGMFSILIDSDDYEFTVRVSPEADNYDPANVGVETGLINADSPTFDADHHLHLTTGNLTQTSIFLGTDNHSVRTTVDGSIKITTTTYGAVDRLDSSTSQGGYNTGTYTGLTTTGGSGTGLTVNATSTGGYIDFVTIVNPGTGYTNGDVLTLVGGDGFGCTLNVIVLGSSEWKFNADGTTTFPTLTVPISDNATPTGTGQTIKFSDSTQQAIIFGPVSTVDNNSAERVIIQGAPGYAGTGGEGGDVYLWAGPGGDLNGNGGDIKVRAGRGNGSGQGGYLNFQAGDSSTGSGGYVNIESGEGAANQGGDIDINARNGGNINLYTIQDGTITLSTAGSSWVFGTGGNLTVPGNIIPAADVTYDLGSSTNRFRDLYLSTSTVYIGTSTISISETGQMLVNGNDAISKLEYFGGEGFGPRDAAYIAWNTSTFTFNIPGKELLTAIYDLKPGNKIRAANTFGFDQEFTIVGNARQYTRDGEFLMAAVDVAETTATNVYAFSLYLPVKDKSATLANGTWTLSLSALGGIVFPDGSTQTGGAISLSALKTLVAASTDFADFKSRIAAL